MLESVKKETSAGRVDLSCDRCGAFFASTVTAADPEVTLAAARAQGWQAEWLGGMWWHRCPECGPIAVG